MVLIVFCLFVPGMHRNGFRMETSLGFAAAPRCSHGSCAGEHVTFVSDQFADHCVALTCRPIFYGRHFYEFHIRHFSPLNLQHRKQDLKIIADFVSFIYIYISYRICNIFCYHLLQPQFFDPVKQICLARWPVGLFVRWPRRSAPGWRDNRCSSGWCPGSWSQLARLVLGSQRRRLSWLC